ncbi:MAG: diadenylate cyclase CdaA [Myxococcota bacterium]
MMEPLVDWYLDSPFSTATWADVIDIFVLAAAIDGLLTVIRGTRAFQSLIGIGLLFAVYVAARATDLTAVTWVLDSVFVYAVLGVLIVFQEDVRRVLASAGGTVFRSSGQASGAALLEEVVKAAFRLASKRIGALVAIEQSARLDSYLQGGHPIDGVLTAELLQSLFHPTSPVHDGAVVLRAGRIESAGVFLPISLSKGLPKVYGTRHRAAIGLTEQTDAICLLVSEERGTVALVQRGQVRPVADANDLRQRLNELLEREESEDEDA